MSKRLIFALVLMVLGTAGLSGCDPVMTCEPDMLVRPVPISPDWGEVVDRFSVTFEWIYPDLCRPEHFAVRLYRDRERTDLIRNIFVDGMETSWTPDYSLDPAQEYWWSVEAISESIWTSPSDNTFFVTDPVCDPADLVPPVLVSPIEGGLFIRGEDALVWEWPSSTCVPTNYLIEVSPAPDFSDTSLFGATGPTTVWSLGDAVPAATQLWWRVIPVVDGVSGPASDTETFITDPICSGASLVEPVALTPGRDDPVPTGDPEFTWSYPDTGCIPEGYHLRIFNTWDWESTVLDVYNPTNFALSYQPEVPLPDCGDYRWQVQMISDGEEGPWNISQRFIIDGGSCDCASDASPVPILVGPEPYEILSDTTAPLRWDSPGGCFPDGVSLKLSSDREFVDTAWDRMIPSDSVIAAEIPGLTPATQYWWKVAYYVNDDSGEPVIGEYSDDRSFFTGPPCASAAEIGIPIQIAPAEGAVVDTTVPMFNYVFDGSCIPEGVVVNLHMLPDFSDPDLMGWAPVPATSTYPAAALDDCEEYFWRVAGTQGGVDGPFSEVWSFFVDESGSCPTPGTRGTAKSDTSCRGGISPDDFKPLWTFDAGDMVLAIAINPQKTHFKLAIIDQNTQVIRVPEVYCWASIADFQPDIPGTFDQLPVEYPPVVVEELVCKSTLGEKKCIESGGIYHSQNQICQCP